MLKFLKYYWVNTRFLIAFSLSTTFVAFLFVNKEWFEIWFWLNFTIQGVAFMGTIVGYKEL